MKATLRETRRTYETKLARIFISGQAADTIHPRRDRFTKLREVKEAIRETLGFPVVFSTYAGCSCPCSPGFVAAGPIVPRDSSKGISDNRHVEYYMDITQEEEN